ncbi:MAG: c-type cytochrome [Rhodospirillaceae bacterium]
MFTRSLCAAFLFSLPALAADSPQLGQPITEADIAPWNIDIAPDGAGLPAGGGNAVKGEEIYLEKCASCHGFDGVGTPADAFVSDQKLLATPKGTKTVGSYWPYAPIIFDYTRRAMPLNNPQTLTNDEVYALTAYILKLNGIIGEKDVMNAKTLPRVKMPNRDGFIQIWPGNLKTP